MTRIFALSLCGFSFIGLSAAHSATPATLIPTGEYDVECASIRVTEVEGLGIRRSAGTTLGTAVIVAKADKVIRKDVYSVSFDRQLVGVSDDFAELVITDLGNNQFEETATMRSRFSPTNTTNSPSDDTIKTKRVFEVKDNTEINLKVQTGTDPEKPGVGETQFGKTSDGAITTFSYIRKSYVRDAQTLAGGSIVPRTTVLQSSEFCTYKKK